MSENWLRKVLEGVKAGKLSLDDAVQQLSSLPYEELLYAKPDHHRHLRLGFPEVVLGQGKTVEQIVTIVQSLASRSDRVLVTRASREVYTAVLANTPDATYNELARAIVINRANNATPKAGIVIACAGTADTPVAEEAAVTAELMGNKVDRIYDVGVAGLHRLIDKLPQLQQARVIVVAAGMEGALPSILGGIIPVPIIAIPTSVGYGAHFNGLAPLLAMLNSCAPGVSVVNIDNGFGAGYLAGLINRL